MLVSITVREMDVCGMKLQKHTCILDSQNEDRIVLARQDHTGVVYHTSIYISELGIEKKTIFYEKVFKMNGFDVPVQQYAEAQKAEGTPTSKQFITDLLPKDFLEMVYEQPFIWACEVNGYTLEQDDWEELEAIIRKEFKGALVNIRSVTDNGAHFIVYLRK